MQMTTESMEFIDSQKQLYSHLKVSISPRFKLQAKKNEKIWSNKTNFENFNLQSQKAKPVVSIDSTITPRKNLDLSIVASEKKKEEQKAKRQIVIERLQQVKIFSEGSPKSHYNTRLMQYDHCSPKKSKHIL